MPDVIKREAAFLIVNRGKVRRPYLSNEALGRDIFINFFLQEVFYGNRRFH